MRKNIEICSKTTLYERGMNNGRRAKTGDWRVSYDVLDKMTMVRGKEKGRGSRGKYVYS